MRNSSRPRVSLDDDVGQDNPVRSIDALVEGRYLAAAGFVRVAPKETGRTGLRAKGSAEALHLRYLNHVGSIRRLEAETPPEYRSDLAVTAPDPDAGRMVVQLVEPV